MTLLEVVQNIMSSFSLEEVNSIEDVPEALQIATVVKETYYDIIAHKDWEFLNKTFPLDSSGDLGKPVIMRIPSRVAFIEFLKYYDTNKGMYTDVEYLSPEDFVNLLGTRKVGGSVVEVAGLVQNVTAKFKIYNDRQPTYYTSFNEQDLIFDSYDSVQDSILQGGKSLLKGNVHPSFMLTDEYEIEMPEEMIWSYLLPESKSVASVNLLQQLNEKEEQRSRRGRHRMYHSHPKTTDEYRRKVVRYGRK
jgi:hypothetical protein